MLHHTDESSVWNTRRYDNQSNNLYGRTKMCLKILDGLTKTKNIIYITNFDVQTYKKRASNYLIYRVFLEVEEEVKV